MKLSKRDNILLAVILLVAGVGGFYWFYVKPAKKDLDAKQAQVAQVEQANDGLRDTITRLQQDAAGLSGQAAERLSYAKAVPDSAQVPAAIYQLQRLADRTNVEFTAIASQQTTDFGGFSGRPFQLKVTGKFFDVDDFLYRMHRMVQVRGEKADVNGRLFAVTKIDMNLATNDGTPGSGTQLKAEDKVLATIDVAAFSTPRPGAPGAPQVTTPGIVSPHIGQASAVPTGGTP